ncbi:MAG: TraM recognition domain-containing protein [Gammaproteobacteria bacterium]|nr:TraM recognition domain-containing protein [Gammaproteobacteria bacterium]
MKTVQRGLEKRQEQNPQQLIRDTRTFGQRVGDFFKNSTSVAVTLIMMAVAIFFVPGLTDLMLLFAVITFLIAVTRKTTLPFRLPLSSGRKDYNDTPPGSDKPRKGRGIYYFGNERSSNLELWFSNEDMRTHVLIFGSTGSGKTEALVSLCYNSLLQSSGFIYIDGKGDNALFAKIFSMVRSMGREDDLLLINFMTGARDIIGPQKARLSNTMNPFSIGSSSMLSQLVVSLMPDSGQSSDGDMWKGRAIVFVEAIMKVLVAMRDAGYILLDANTIRNYFQLDRIEAMVLEKVFIRDGQEPVSLEGMSPGILEPITNYLINLPGYNKERKGKQVSQVLEQHGFITMQLTRVFGSLADTYGHIIRTNLAEVDLKDVVLNRRIMVVLLPALEKSPDELSNLGKVIIASLKAMMAAGLGDEVEGKYHELIQRKPTNAATPFLCVLDEYGYYAVKGFAVVPAQARSLGFSVIFAGQDLPAFEKASKEEAASIGANTNIKICMKLEDPMQTWEFFQKTAGEAYVTHVSGFQSEARGLLNSYLDNRGAQLEKRSRIDLMDLKDQREGEAHIFFKSSIIRAKMFYANPKPVKAMRLNQFLKVDGPLDSLLDSFDKNIRSFEHRIHNGGYFTDTTPLYDDLEKIADAINANENVPPIEKAVSALLAYHERDVAPVKEEIISLPENELNIFTPLRVNEYLLPLLLNNEDRFKASILNPGTTKDQIGYVERLLGKSEQYANNVASEIVKDMQSATHYPPVVDLRPTGDEIAEVINQLVGTISLKKQEAATASDATSSDE